jgi:hypothetical protein
VFITAVPIIKLESKLFALGEGDSGGHVLRETTSRVCVYYCRGLCKAYTLVRLNFVY